MSDVDLNTKSLVMRHILSLIYIGHVLYPPKRDLKQYRIYNKISDQYLGQVHCSVYTELLGYSIAAASRGAQMKSSVYSYATWQKSVVNNYVIWYCQKRLD